MAEKMKRKVSFATQEQKDAGEDPTETKRIKTFKDKHSLDSDEEDKVDEVATYEMKEDELEGCEDEDAPEHEEDFKITPFNLKQEMSEGYFDKDGNYYEKKDDDDVQDEWLENIDWERLEEENAMKRQDKGADADDESEGDAKEARPELEVMKEMLDYMKEGESVIKAMKRLGGVKKKAGAGAQRKAKKWEKEAEADPTNEVTAETKANMLKLTDLVDELVARGIFDMYEYTYEKIQHRLKQGEDSKAAKDDSEFDMFAAEVDDKKLTTNTRKEDEQGSIDPDKVYWEYKWEDKEEADVYGPYESEQMQNWSEEDYFKDGIFVRKVGSGQSFYSSRRIDFSLYV